MRDIFLSYSSADREVARRVAAGLEQRGWTVWWDVQIPPGRAYDEVIVEALEGARCVVVLWSATSGDSMWVKNEAAEAMNRRNLVPATIEQGVKIPFEFRRLQAADLSRWSGDPAAPEFAFFCDAIALHAPILGGQPTPPAPPVPPPAPAPIPSLPAPVPAAGSGSGKRKLWMVAAAIVGVLVVLASLVPEDDPQPRPAPAPSPSGGVAQLTTPLAWRDRSLRYNGTVSWDGRATVAQVMVGIADGATGRPITETTLSAGVTLDAPGRWVFSSQVPVPGDSETPHPHSHSINLVFEMRNGRLVFVRNCAAPNDCYEAGS